MKVVHLTTVHPCDVRILNRECRTLADAGHDVTLIARHDKDETVDGVRIIALPKPKGRLHRMTVLVFKAFWLAMKERADIYHFHDPELLPAGLLLRLAGKKTIYDIHEDVPRDILTKKWIPPALRGAVSRLAEIMENIFSRFMNYNIAATPHISGRFSRQGCRAIDVNNYPILDEMSLPEAPAAEKERAVCYTGGICDFLGIFQMVEAIGKTDAVLLLAGSFVSLNERERASNMPGWKNVRELGYISRPEVIRTLKASMCGLVLYHPVCSVSQPNKMFEYMSAGIPVIASDFPLWKEIIEGNGCGICVDPFDAGAIADAIRRMVDNPDEARRMGKNGRKAVEEKYNWEIEGKKLLSIYEGLRGD